MGISEKKGSDNVSDLRVVFGSNLRRLRQQKRLSQRELDGVSQKTVSAVERGEVNLSLAVMERLARAVGADVKTLLVTSEVAID